ncbi:hypothetical protein ACJX0J_013426 [Zea mays]
MRLGFALPDVRQCFLQIHFCISSTSFLQFLLLDMFNMDRNLINSLSKFGKFEKENTKRKTTANERLLATKHYCNHEKEPPLGNGPNINLPQVAHEAASELAFASLFLCFI